jgi:leader peptidase (prepilin peptidase)/N-methyltransferase
VLIAAALVGAAFGSFLNVVICRLPRAAENGSSFLRALIGPRSACPHCARTIPPAENIPLVSYWLVGGRCRGCGEPISWRYPLIEGLGAMAAAGLVWRYGVSPVSLAAFAFIAIGLAIAAIDAEHMVVPDLLSLPLLTLGLAVNGWGLFVPFSASLIGAAVGFASLWLIFRLTLLVTGREALGIGDFKLFAAIGAWFGWMMLPLVLFIASVTGCAIGLMMRAGGSLGPGSPMPFAPFLVTGAIVTIFYGKTLAGLF